MMAMAVRCCGAVLVAVGWATLVAAAPQSGETRPAPRNDQGRALLYTPGEAGTWSGHWPGIGSPGRGIEDPRRVDAEGNPVSMDAIPWKPWARALYEYRQLHELEPHARCKMSGIIRQHQTPYGMEILEAPELQRIYIFDIGGPHSFRTIYLDGRGHPDPDDFHRNGYGHSIGWWEGDTLVVDTTLYDETFWMNRTGIPHTEELRTVERFTRVDYDTLRYEVTIHDPRTFTQPWGGWFEQSWEPGKELFEYVCQERNTAPEMMRGHYEEVDWSSPFIP